jgi:hypothetical protein
MTIARIRHADFRDAVRATIRAILPVAAKNFPVLRRRSSRSLRPCLQTIAGKSSSYSRGYGVVGDFFPLVSRSYGKTGGAACN